MKKFLLILFLISAGYNTLQHFDNRDLRIANTSLHSSNNSYQVMFDAQDAEANEVQAISAHLTQRNSHVPGVVVSNWATTIQKSSKQYDINVNVMLQLYRVESATVHYSQEGFITVSHKNAGGLGQVMPFWYKECPHSSRSKDLNNANVNIMCSAYILRHYMDYVAKELGVTEPAQNMFLALTAYNAGPTGAKLMLRGRDITNGYAKSILTGQARTGKTWRI